MFQRTPSALSSFEKAKRDAALTLKRLPFVSWFYETRDVNHLLLVPRDLRTADPSLSIELDMGQFGLAGATVLLQERSPFFVEPPNKAWASELHGFSWVRHLQAARSERALQQALDLNATWLDHFRSQKGLAWQPEIAAQRLINWLCYSNFLLQKTDEHHYIKFIDAIDDHMRYLTMTAPHAGAGMPRLHVLIATVFAGLCVANQEKFLEAQAKLLCNELERQILSDGGHSSRNNALLALILLDLLPLKQCFVSRDLTPPQPLVDAINRMLPMIHYMRLGDGLLSRFNGAGTTLPDTLSTAMSYDDAMSQPLVSAEASKYFRLQQGNVIVLMDGGSAPPLPLSKKAHAGCLSFEVSSGTCPIIVNCGAAPPAFHTMANNARATVCHSTLTINNRSSAQFIHDKTLKTEEDSLIEGPLQVMAEVEHGADQAQILGSHDGYLEAFGLIHHRRLSLATDGYKLSGEDWIELPEGRETVQRGVGLPYAVHFHIHPDVQAERAGDGTSITLTLPDSQVWTFTANGAVIFLEESIFYADFAGPCQSMQMVIRGTCAGPVTIGWALAKTIDIKTPDPKKVPSWLADNVIPLEPPEKETASEPTDENSVDEDSATEDSTNENSAEEEDAAQDTGRERASLEAKDDITDLVEDTDEQDDAASGALPSAQEEDQKAGSSPQQKKSSPASERARAKKRKRRKKNKTRSEPPTQQAKEKTSPRSKRLMDRLPPFDASDASPPPLPAHMKPQDKMIDGKVKKEQTKEQRRTPPAPPKTPPADEDRDD